MKVICIILIFFIICCQATISNALPEKGAILTFVDIDSGMPTQSEEIKLACDLLGVKFKSHLIGMKNDIDTFKAIKELQEKEAFILTGRVLRYINNETVSMILKKNRKTSVLILGIDNDTDMADLKIWSGKRIKSFSLFNSPTSAASLRLVENDQISKELGGMEYPLNGSAHGAIRGFEIEKDATVTKIIDLLDSSGKPVFPVFLKTDSARASVFFLSAWEKAFSPEINTRFKMAPLLMFLKYAFGDRCWHGISDYANLTIDDPWLREPYGYISFADLCRQAADVRFHATIGFIPYNYQTNHPDAIETFRKCQRNLSIAVHGNNHDFSEFNSNENVRLNGKSSGDNPPDEQDIVEALSRMDSFSQQTGLPYDRVMIFPRGSFTVGSLQFLKKHNFLMTVNSMRPMNEGQMADEVDRMREITLEFENFPVAVRHGLPTLNDKHAFADLRNWIQMRLFLDLPVFLYTHHSYFKAGSNAFDIVASEINKTKPTIEWSGLGNIARHLYLQRRTDDDQVEVLSYSSDIVIKNIYPTSMRYTFRKKEDFSIPIRSVEVDGVEHEYKKENDHVRINVMIKPGREKNIRILYASGPKGVSFKQSENDLSVILIRSLSNFRDIYLSKLPLGDKMVTAFYSLGGVRNVLIIFACLVMIIVIFCILHIRRSHSKKRISVD